MECHRIANGLIRPGQELPDDFDLDILESEEYRGTEETEETEDKGTDDKGTQTGTQTDQCPNRG
jgi:hypothetical protein